MGVASGHTNVLVKLATIYLCNALARTKSKGGGGRGAEDGTIGSARAGRPHGHPHTSTATSPMRKLH